MICWFDAGAHYVGTDLHEVLASSETACGYAVSSDGEQPLDVRPLSGAGAP
jgi:hypothetical protein